MTDELPRSATVELVFAPDERDVYSYERVPNGLAPLGAKPATDEESMALLRSFESKEKPAINISPRLRLSDKRLTADDD